MELDTAFYEHVRVWRAWWEGYYKPFHSYREYDLQGVPRERKLYTLRMAKRVCEDWATILLNEQTSVTVADAKSGVFLQGEDGNGGLLQALRFWQQGNELVERAFAVGTGAFVLRIQGARVSAAGRVTPGGGAAVRRW